MTEGFTYHISKQGWDKAKSRVLIDLSMKIDRMIKDKKDYVFIEILGNLIE